MAKPSLADVVVVGRILQRAARQERVLGAAAGQGDARVENAHGDPAGLTRRAVRGGLRRLGEGDGAACVAHDVARSRQDEVRCHERNESRLGVPVAQDRQEVGHGMLGVDLQMGHRVDLADRFVPDAEHPQPRRQQVEVSGVDENLVGSVQVAGPDGNVAGLDPPLEQLVAVAPSRRRR